MADISKIKLPDNSEYDIKSLRTSMSELIPEKSKTFTGVIATANNDPNGYLYFGYAKPTSYKTPWRIRYRIHATINTLTAVPYSYFDMEIHGFQNTYYGWDVYNVNYSSYRSIYNHILYCATETGVANEYGHLIGVRLQSAYKPTDQNYARTFLIEILETENCDFVFFDSMLTFANVPGTGTTNYVNRYLFDGTSAGHKMYGDANSQGQYLYCYNTSYFKSAVESESLACGNADGYCQVTAGATFDITYPLLWITTAISAGGTSYSYTFLMNYDRSLAKVKSDFTSSPRKIIYLVVTLSGTTATVDSNVLSDTLPTTDDGKIYIELGRLGNQSNGQNYFILFPSHPMYWYKNGAVQPYVPNAVTVNGHTVNADVPSGAKFTDTTYESKTAASGGTAVSLVTTGEKYTWNNKSTVPTDHSATATTYGTGNASKYGHVKLSASTSSTSGESGGIAATPSAVKTAYDLANSANTKAGQALSGVNGTLIYDHTYSISNGVATFTAHVYQKGVEVTSSYADSCFSWSYKLANAVTGTPSVVSLGTGKTKTITISTLGYGGYVLGTFTPPSA